MTEKPINEESEQNPYQPPAESLPDPVAPSSDLKSRSFFWIGMFISFFAIAIAVANSSYTPGIIAFTLAVWGATLFIVFFYAVIKRSSGKPLTRDELLESFLLIGFRTFISMIVAPIVLGLALFIALWCICVFSFPRMSGH